MPAHRCGQRVGYPGVESAPHAGRSEFEGNFAQEFVTKMPTVGTPGLQHPRIDEIADHSVDLVVVQRACRAQQCAIDMAPDGGRGLDHRHGVRPRPQSAEKRLVERLRDGVLVVNVAQALGQLFEIERQAVAARANSRPLCLRQPRIQCRDEFVGLLVGQGRQIITADGPIRWQPLPWAPRGHHQEPARACVQQRVQHVDRRRVKPMHVLGNKQSPRHRRGTSAGSSGRPRRPIRKVAAPRPLQARSRIRRRCPEPAPTTARSSAFNDRRPNLGFEQLAGDPWVQ